MPIKDKEARNKYQREYYRQRLASDPEFKARHYAFNKKTSDAVVEKKRELLAEFRKDGCAKCDESDHTCLSAHHIDRSTKEYNVGDLMGGRISVKRFANELSKCVCLCHNCHAKVHAGVLILAG